MILLSAATFREFGFDAARAEPLQLFFGNLDGRHIFHPDDPRPAEDLGEKVPTVETHRFHFAFVENPVRFRKASRRDFFLSNESLFQEQVPDDRL